MPSEEIPAFATPESSQNHSAAEVLRIFFKLGLTSFGGPIAHLGYFRTEFVTRRRWLDDATFTDLLALCQFLPGPASSQVGFSIGVMRAGYLGGLAAWTGFTMPSALLLLFFAYSGHAVFGALGMGLLRGFQLVAVVMVAQAVLGMARTLCPDWRRASIAILAAALALSLGSSAAQAAAILFGAIAGLFLCRNGVVLPMAHRSWPVSRRAGVIALAAFSGLLIGLPAFRTFAWPGLALFDAFYQCGALVFGGGHVVLPLLRDAFVAPGWVSDSTFIAGYGAAQAVPGPLFTFAAYLGAIVGPGPHGATGAALGLVGLFLPGMLILIGTLPFWDTLRTRMDAQSAMRGINAAVVGLLGAALYNPLWTRGVNTPADLGVALIGLFLLTLGHVRPVVVVALITVSGPALVQWHL